MMSKTCDNCHASLPEGHGGRLADGRWLCCGHCFANPLGCRCQFGEFGEPETCMLEDEDP